MAFWMKFQRVVSYQERRSQEAESRQAAYEAVTRPIQIESNTSTTDFLKSIAETTSIETYEAYYPVDLAHSLLIDGDTFAIVQTNSSEKILLENVQEAYILPVTETKNGETNEFNAIFAQKDGNWYQIIYNEGQIEWIALDNSVALQATSKIRIVDGTFEIVQ
ncbi:MAG: hypothetical protein Q4B80_06375 [Aerococcaceae bacterium]|nr:hypothetical protein [Aerococcaceae bacterium]